MATASPYPPLLSALGLVDLPPKTCLNLCTCFHSTSSGHSRLTEPRSGLLTARSAIPTLAFDLLSPLQPEQSRKPRPHGVTASLKSFQGLSLTSESMEERMIPNVACPLTGRQVGAKGLSQASALSGSNKCPSSRPPARKTRKPVCSTWCRDEVAQLTTLDSRAAV